MIWFRVSRLLILTLLTLTGVVGTWTTVQATDPRQRGEDGFPIRQGHHIEWQRASYRRADGYVLVVWSDTRRGDRDVYGQLIRPDGSQAWASTGVPIIAYPEFRQEDPDVVAVDGGWIIGWIEYRNDSTGDIWAQKINDNGQPLWDPNGVMVDELPYISPVYELSLRVANDGQGGAILAWQDLRRGDAGDIYAQRVLANGTRAWANALAVTDTTGGQSDITADSDGQGNMIVAWVDSRDPSNENLYCAKITAAGQLPWGGVNGRVVCDAPQRQSGVKLCPDGQGGCYITWGDQRAGSSNDLYIQRLTANGQPAWTANGLLLCGAPDDQDQVRIAVSLNGGQQDGAILSWQDKRVNGTITEVYAQKITAAGDLMWGNNGIFVCGDATPDFGGHVRDNPRLSSDLAGGAIIAWEDTRTDGLWRNCDVYAARVLANGTLGWNGACGLRVFGGSGQQHSPLLRVNTGNGIFVFADDLRTGSQSLRYQTVNMATGAFSFDTTGIEIVAGLDGDAVNVASVNLHMGRAAFVWEDNRTGRSGTTLYYQIVDTLGQIDDRPINGVPLVPDNQGYELYSQMSHHVCPDGSEGFFVCYEDGRTGRKQVRLTHVDGAGNLLCPAAASLIFPDTNTVVQQSVFVTPDNAGGCYVAWSNSNRYYISDVYVMRMSSTCQPMWTQPVRLTDTEDDDVVAGIVTNPDGCCIVAWRSGPLEDFNVYSAKVCASGNVAWNVVVCNAVNRQYDPVIAADGQGGAYYAWIDFRQPAYFEDIYAQRLNADGSPAWQTNGIVVINDSLLQANPVIEVDSQGNLYVAWEDFRSGSELDLYAQKISPAGIRLWPTRGRPISVGPGDQSDVVIHREWSDGLYFVWADLRGLHDDVYGTHINAQGNLADGGAYWHSEVGGILCDFYQKQNKATTTADGHGGILCAWEDARASGKEPLVNIWGNWINDYTVSVREVPNSAVPKTHELGQNYPNPFNPSTVIRFAIPQREQVEIDVFNTLGQKAVTLVNEVMDAGAYDLKFKADQLPSGVYFYRLKTPTFQSTRKMVLVR